MKVKFLLLISWMTCLIGFAQINLDSGLVGYYPFNGNATDESPYTNDGSVNGPSITSDRLNSSGKAYEFDGINDYIDLGNDASLKMTEGVSIALWIKAYNFPPVRYMNLVSDHSPPTSAGYNQGKIFRFDRDTLEFLRHPQHIAIQAQYILDSCYLNQWIHVAATFDGQYMKIYMNGDLVTTTSDPGDVPVQPKPILVGKSGYVDEYFHGKMDEIRIYDRALSSDEIELLAEGGVYTDPYVDLGNDTLVCDNVGSGAYTLDAGAGHTSYLWSTGATTQTITTSVSGNYSVSVQGSSGCVGEDDVSVEFTTCLGLQEASAQAASASIYPNPNHGNFNLLWSGELGTKAIIYDNTGRAVWNGELRPGKNTLALSSISPGVYFVGILSGSEHAILKLVVQ